MKYTTSFFLRAASTASLCMLACGCHESHIPRSAPSPSFTIEVNPAGLAIPAGGGSYATVVVSRIGGFRDAVVLSLDGAPAGIVGSGIVASGAMTGQLSLIVASGVAPQTLDAVRLKGTSGGLTQVATFKLVVASALPTGQIRADQVQASGGTQAAGMIVNTSIAMEPVAVVSTKDAAGTTEVRTGFKPNGTPN